MQLSILFWSNLFFIFVKLWRDEVICTGDFSKLRRLSDQGCFVHCPQLLLRVGGTHVKPDLPRARQRRLILSLLVLFQPHVSLRDRCKCLLRPWHARKKSDRCSLFIYQPSSHHPHPPPRRSNLLFSMPAPFFSPPSHHHPQHPQPAHSFRDLSTSDRGGCWDDRISLSAGSLVSLLLAFHQPTSSWFLHAAAATHTFCLGPHLNPTCLEDI